MESVEPIRREVKKIRIHGNPMRELIFKAPKNKPFTREDIGKYLDRFNKELTKGGFKGQISVGLWYEDEQNWFQSKFTDVGEPIKLYSFADEYDVPELDPETYSKVIIQVTKYNKNKGGSGNGNNCLYECLLKVVPNLTDYYPTPARLKYELKLGVDEKIPIDKIKIIEDTLKDYRINVSGEYEYISTKKSEI